MRRIFLELASLVVVGSWTLGVPLAAAPSTNGADLPNHLDVRQHIPVRILGGFLVVAEGQFGGAWQHQNFVLDTGTSHSILNLRIARQLGLDLSPAKLAAVGQNSEAQVATVPDFALGPLKLNSTSFLVADLGAVERSWKVPIAGILGLDILGQINFRLDYEKHILEFGGVNFEGIPVGLSAQLGLPIAEVTVNGRALRLLVDTGSDRLVVFGRKNDPQLPAQNGAQLLSGKSVAGTVPVRALPAMEFEWNGRRFRQDAVVIPESEEPSFDGLLSVRSMGFRSIAMDAGSHVVYLRK